jgi:hypothetical protein
MLGFMALQILSNQGKEIMTNEDSGIAGECIQNKGTYKKTGAKTSRNNTKVYKYNNST